MDALSRIRLEIRRAAVQAWRPIQRTDAIEPQLGKRLDVRTRSESVEDIASGKIVRSFGSLALPVPTGRPRQRGALHEAAALL